MGQTPDQIKNEVEAARGRLAQDLNLLEYRVKADLDWRAQFNRRPWLFLGAAFAGSLVLSLLIFGSRRA